MAEEQSRPQRRPPYELREAKDKSGKPTGEWYYVKLAQNGRVLSTSETYASKWNAARGVIDAQEADEAAGEHDRPEPPPDEPEAA